MATEAFVNQNATVKVNVYKYFTANTTFTVPSGVSELTVAVTGAGGGGAGYTQRHIYITGGGGGAGGYLKGILKVTPGQKLTITVGAGGVKTGHIGEYAKGAGDGGSSSIAGYITCYGGTGGNGLYINPTNEAAGRTAQYAGGIGKGCTYSNVSQVLQNTPGKDGVRGVYYTQVGSTYSRGGASAHGANSSQYSSTVWGAGAWGGTHSGSTAYTGHPGSPGLVQIWYKTDIRNITF